MGKLRSCVAAGVSGLTNDHLRQLFPVDTEPQQAALTPLLTFINMALAARMDEETADWLCASALVTLYKPDGEGGLKRRPDGLLDVRPIAIPETLYRLIALCGLQMCKGAISAKLTAMQQLGVGVSSGTEAIATALRLFMDEVTAGEDEFEATERLVSVALCVDASNAFNTVDRDAVLRMVLEVCPGLLPFVRMSYRREGRLVLANRGTGAERFRIFLSRTGVRQGDPLGPVLFALAAMEAMRKVQAVHPGVALPSYADDVNGLIRAKGAAAAAALTTAVFTSLKTAFAAIGVLLNDKTAVLCPADETMGARTGLTQKVGLPLMGVPVGPPAFQLAQAEKRLAPSFAALALLPQLPFGVALQLLRFCISPRTAYLASQLPDTVVGALAPRWDGAIRKCLTAMFKGEPHARCFVSGPGGLDIAVLGEQMHMLRLNGWSRSKTTIDDFFPALRHLTTFEADSTHPVHAEVVRAWHALPNAVSGADGVLAPFSAPAAPTTAPPPSPDKAAVVAAQRKLSRTLSAWHCGQIRAALTPLGRLLWERASGKGAKQWLNTAAKFASVRMDGETARVATCVWLNAPIAELAASTDPTGRTMMRCDRAGKVRRHNSVARVFADLGIEAGHRVWTEAAIFPEFSPAMSQAARQGVARGSARRMDVVTVSPGITPGMAIDGTVVDPATPALLDSWANAVVAACPLEAAEEVKRAHYADTPPAFVCWPCAIDTQMGMGPGTLACANQLALLIATRRNGGVAPVRRFLDAVRRDVHGRLGVAVMRELAGQITSTFAGSPRAGLTQVNAYTHTRFSCRAAGATGACTCDPVAAASLGCACNARVRSQGGRARSGGRA
jgi:hypothetical protein